MMIKGSTLVGWMTTLTALTALSILSTPSAMALSTTTSTTAITADQVSLHNTESDAWVVVNGKVFDITGWIPHHPGGPDVLITRAGMDMTKAFNAKHPGKSLEDNPYIVYLGPLAGRRRRAKLVARKEEDPENGESSGKGDLSGNTILWDPATLFLMSDGTMSTSKEPVPVAADTFHHH